MIIKHYPWLQNPYATNLENIETTGPLSVLDNIKNQKQYVRIFLLDWEENILKNIEGEITSGSISKNGDSAVRTTCSLSCTVSSGTYDPTDIKADYSINKKVYIEIGIKNETDLYPEYDKLWFPQGVFIIESFSISSSAESAIQISLSLKDKMALLDGTLGGIFPATTQLDEMDNRLSTGEEVQEKVKIYNLIQELVHHYGGEDLENIIIQDVPLQATAIKKWSGENTLYLYCRNDIYYPTQNIDDCLNFKYYNGSDYITINSSDIYDNNTWIDYYRNCGLDKTQDGYYNIGNSTFFYSSENNKLTTTSSFSTDGKKVFNLFDNNKNLLPQFMNTSLEVDTYKYEKTFNTETELINYLSSNVNAQFFFKWYAVSNSKYGYIPCSENTNNGYSSILGAEIKQLTSSIYSVYNNISYWIEPIKKYNTVETDNYYCFNGGKTYFSTLSNNNAISFEETPQDNLICGVLRDNTNTLVSTYKDYNMTKGNIKTWKADSSYYCINNNIAYKAQTLNCSESPTLKNPNEEGTDKYTVYSTYNNVTDIITVPAGSDCCYETVDLVYDEELTVNAGTTITSVLDTIKNWLQNFEYFYDCYGIFHFQEIKNYLNNSITSYDLDTTLSKIDDDKYYYRIDDEGSVYTFSDADNLVSVTLNPQYTNIKNDFIVQGTKSENSQDVRLHIAIDEKPVINSDGYSPILVYYDPAFPSLKIAKLGVPHEWNKDSLNYDLIYHKTDGSFVYWKEKDWVELDTIAYYEDEDNPYIAKDWRTEIILQGLQAEAAATEVPQYYEELVANWGNIYDLANQEFRTTEKDKYTNASISCLYDSNFYFDMIDAGSAAYGQYSKELIGSRQNVTVEDSVNCLFARACPQLLLLHSTSSASESEIEEAKIECLKNQMNLILFNDEEKESPEYNSLTLGGSAVSAFDKIQYDITVHTTYQNGISLTTLPVFYIEPNSKILVKDKTTGTYGYYMIDSISYSLGAGQTMSISGTQSLENI